MKKLLLIYFLIAGYFSFSQQVHEVLNHELISVTEKKLYKKKSNFHTSVRPFYHHEIQKEFNLDSTNNLLKKENRAYLTGDTWWAKTVRWGENKLLDDDLVKNKLGVLNFRLNPIVNFSAGTESISKTSTWRNTRGFDINGAIGEKFSFNTAFVETQAQFSPQITNYIIGAYQVPGQGRFKPFKDETAVDYGFSRAIMIYKPNETFTFQFGHGKNFLGDGYRSLLLSDNAFNYPFLKIETNFWNIKYVNIYAQLNHMGFVDGGADRLFDRKYMAAQYLSWNINKRLNFSLFEMVTWRSLPTRDFDANYLNPIIFLRPVEFQNGSKDKVMIGATTKYKLMNNLSLYGQLIVDDLKISEFKNGTKWWGNKYGIQLGLKSFDVFKIRGLSAQFEYNIARPYTYSHSDSITAYTQLNQPLAHPLGANFEEGVAFIRYNHKRHYLQIKGLKAVFGLDTGNINHGQDIFYSYNTNRLQVEGDLGDFGHETLQGLKTSLTIFEAKYSYMINPSSNLMLEIGITNRSYSNALTSNKTRHIFFGIKTSLSNFYYDFL